MTDFLPGGGLAIVFIVLLTWLVPIAVTVWIVMTLSRIRSAQDAMRIHLVAIERSLAAGSK